MAHTPDVSTSRVCLQHMTERTPNVPASRACPNYMINLTMQNDAHGFPTFPYFGPSFRIHSHKNGGTAQFYHLLKQNWKLSFCHSTTAVRTNSNTQFLLHSYPCFDGVHFTLCVCVCVLVCMRARVCVCVCVSATHPNSWVIPETLDKCSKLSAQYEMGFLVMNCPLLFCCCCFSR